MPAGRLSFVDRIVVDRIGRGERVILGVGCCKMRASRWCSSAAGYT